MRDRRLQKPEPGEIAFFSVQLQTRPGELACGTGSARPPAARRGNSGKTDSDEECPEGDMGALEMDAVS